MVKLTFEICCRDEDTANKVRESVSLDAWRTLPGVTSMSATWTVNGNQHPDQVWPF